MREVLLTVMICLASLDCESRKVFTASQSFWSCRCSGLSGHTFQPGQEGKHKALSGKAAWVPVAHCRRQGELSPGSRKGHARNVWGAGSPGRVWAYCKAGEGAIAFRNTARQNDFDQTFWSEARQEASAQQVLPKGFQATAKEHGDEGLVAVSGRTQPSAASYSLAAG